MSANEFNTKQRRSVAFPKLMSGKRLDIDAVELNKYKHNKSMLVLQLSLGPSGTLSKKTKKEVKPKKPYRGFLCRRTIRQDLIAAERNAFTRFCLIALRSFPSSVVQRSRSPIPLRFQKLHTRRKWACDSVYSPIRGWVAPSSSNRTPIPPSGDGMTAV